MHEEKPQAGKQQYMYLESLMHPHWDHLNKPPYQYTDKDCKPNVFIQNKYIKRSSPVNVRHSLSVLSEWIQNHCIASGHNVLLCR